MVVFVFQNNEFLHERLLYKGPTITERSKKVPQLLTYRLHSKWRVSISAHCFVKARCAVLSGVCPSFCLKLAGKYLKRIRDDWVSHSCFSSMHRVGASCARLKRPSPQNGGRRLGVEWWWAGWGERGGQSCCSSSAGKTLHVCATWRSRLLYKAAISQVTVCLGQQMVLLCCWIEHTISQAGVQCWLLLFVVTLITFRLIT